jgi:hypothetical protein
MGETGQEEEWEQEKDLEPEQEYEEVAIGQESFSCSLVVLRQNLLADRLAGYTYRTVRRTKSLPELLPAGFIEGLTRKRVMESKKQVSCDLGEVTERPKVRHWK